MLFNSYEFIFLYLPVVLVGYFCLGRARRSELANVWLVAASLAFYGYWDARYLPLLVGSIAVNYVLSGRIIAARAAVKAATAERRAAKKALKALAASVDGQAPAATAETADAERRMAAAEQAELAHGRVAKYWFLAGAAFNVALLGFFKYTDFLLENLNYLGADFSLLHIVLPLGISFFTITQLAYLIDCNRGEVTEERHRAGDYALFVSFFPHLLAGPILYHRDMLGQFADAGRRRVNWENMSRGLSLFILGLGKKVLIADALAPYATASFAAPGELSMLEAWAAALCYTLQLFFDFSGYSDMAVGIARMLNIKIPFNFDSPYRAYGVADFWRRWHMSLGAWVKNYLYIPLGGNRAGFSCKLRNLMLSMGIVGLWHGAGWTFIAWGVMHGVGLVADSVWRRYHLPMWRPLGYVLTFVFVMIAWVFFRAASLGDALTILTAMFTGELLVPQKVADLAQHAGVVLPALTAWAAPKKYLLLAVLMVALLPSSQSLVERLRPRPIYAVALAALLLLSIVSLTRVSEFLYFQF